MATKKTVSKKPAKAVVKKQAAKPVVAKKVEPAKQASVQEGNSDNYQPQFIGESFRQRVQRAPL